MWPQAGRSRANSSKNIPKQHLFRLFNYCPKSAIIKRLYKAFEGVFKLGFKMFVDLCFFVFIIVCVLFICYFVFQCFTDHLCVFLTNRFTSLYKVACGPKSAFKFIFINYLLRGCLQVFFIDRSKREISHPQLGNLSTSCSHLPNCGQLVRTKSVGYETQRVS